jgi:FixJ family two-component response regulator
MPGLTGLELQAALAATGRRLSIVFITGYGDIRMSVKAMQGGATDFLTKPVSDGELLGAIDRGLTIAGQAQRAHAAAAEIHARIKALTAREAEVFALVVTGMLNKQIAAELGIGEGTVKVHRGRVMEKMRAASLAELVRLAGQAGVTTAKS